MTKLEDSRKEIKDTRTNIHMYTSLHHQKHVTTRAYGEKPKWNSLSGIHSICMTYLFYTLRNCFTDAKELKIAMTKLGEALTDKELAEMMRDADINKDGKIDYDGKILFTSALMI